MNVATWSVIATWTRCPSPSRSRCLGAEERQHERYGRPRHLMGQVEDPDAVERAPDMFSHTGSVGVPGNRRYWRTV
jgi:hypothetical protein